MSALIWKELRQNLKWAILAMAFLGAAELFVLYQVAIAGSSIYRSYNDGVTLSTKTFLTVTTFGCAAAGFALGLLQVLPELKRDHWATLIHRPIRRGTVFLGKALAGMTLYLLATGLPFLFCVWLAATPGHFAAPFVPDLARPGFVDIGMGLVYYFSGLLLALHRSGWVGAKVLPLLAALHVSYFVGATPSFHEAIEATVLMTAVLALAGWGAIHHLESWSARPWLGKVAFLVVGFYGLCGIGDLAWFVTTMRNVGVSSYQVYEIADNSRPVKLTYLNGALVSVQDLEGHTLKEANYQPDGIRRHLQHLNTCSSFIGDSHGWKRLENILQYRDSMTYLRVGSPYNFPRLEQWFYLLNQRYAVGVLPDQKLPMAVLDARGFQPASAPPVPFAPDVHVASSTQDGYVIWDARSVRAVNLSQRQITNLELPLPGPVYGVCTASARSESGNAIVTAIAFGSAMAIYDDRSRRLVATLPYHREMDRWGSLDVGINSTLDRFYLRYDPSMWISRGIRISMPSYFEEMNAQGEILHEYAMPPLPNRPRSRSWAENLAQRVRSPAFFFGTLLCQKMGSAPSGVAGTLGEETQSIATEIILLSVVCATVTLWWARRGQFSWRCAWSWAAFALAFNVAGLLLFRLVAEWPRRIPCSSCRRLRPIDAESCPHCAAAWPEITPNGTEIFEPPDLSSAETIAPA